MSMLHRLFAEVSASQPLLGRRLTDAASQKDIQWKKLKQVLVAVSVQIVCVAAAYVLSNEIVRLIEGFWGRRSIQAKGKDNKGKRRLVLNEYEAIIAEHIVESKDISATFESIGGLEEHKAEIMDLVILPLKRPDLFASRSSLVAAPKGVLFYGPPGTGKTLLAKAIAKESGATFLNLTMSTLMNKYFGESNKLVAAVFSLAHKVAPSIVFIDEIDCFLSARGRDTSNDAQTGMKAEFMSHWDGLLTGEGGGGGAGAGGGHVMVLGATNRPFDLDPAILRRLPRSFEIGLPGEGERASILRVLLQREALDPHGPALPELCAAVAAQTPGYSGSDLKEVCRAALMGPIREMAAAHRLEEARAKAGSGASVQAAATTAHATEEAKAAAVRGGGAADPATAAAAAAAAAAAGVESSTGAGAAAAAIACRPLGLKDLEAALGKVGRTGAAAGGFREKERLEAVREQLRQRQQTRRPRQPKPAAQASRPAAKTAAKTAGDAVNADGADGDCSSGGGRFDEEGGWEDALGELEEGDGDDGRRGGGVFGGSGSSSGSGSGSGSGAGLGMSAAQLAAAQALLSVLFGGAATGPGRPAPQGGGRSGGLN